MSEKTQNVIVQMTDMLTKLIIYKFISPLDYCTNWFTERLNSLFNSLPAYHYKTMVMHVGTSYNFLQYIFNVFQEWIQDREITVSILGMSLKCNDL